MQNCNRAPAFDILSCRGPTWASGCPNNRGGGFMLRRIPLVFVLCCVGTSGAFAQANATKAGDGATRPGPAAPLFFRVDWQPVSGVPVEHPLDQKAISNPALELKLYGPSGKDIQENGVPDNASNPMHLWTGLCA